MTTMIERVTLAIREAHNSSYDWEGIARVAIAAMREPTEAMLSIQTVRFADGYKPIWQAMIDCALEDK